MAHILVIEDEEDLRQVLEYNLSSAGHRVTSVGSGEEGVRAALGERPNLVLLDLMLPDTSGTDVCKALRAQPETRAIPVIMLTARSEEIDRVVGFEIGADDYVTKPFSVRELTLRIEAVLRRVNKEPDKRETIHFGCLTIDPSAHRAWVSGEEIELSALEFRLLLTLYSRRNRVQSRPVLLEEVWGMRSDITTRTVDTHVKRLREKLGDARNYVETVRGVGYRFVEHPEGEES